MTKKQNTTAGMAGEIATYVMRGNRTPHDLRQHFRLTLPAAQAAIDRSAYAFGPGGKGYDWYMKQLGAILKGKNVFEAASPQSVAAGALSAMNRSRDASVRFLDEATVPQTHQRKIAVSTLKMSAMGAKIMGGMDHAAAVAVLKDAGWSPTKIAAQLKKAGHVSADIKKWMGESIDEAFSPKDKKVIDAFLDKKSAEGKKLSTDGKSLDIGGIGGRGAAVWQGGKIHFQDLGGKSSEQVERAVRKAAPKNWIGESLDEAGQGDALHAVFRAALASAKNPAQTVKASLDAKVKKLSAQLKGPYNAALKSVLAVAKKGGTWEQARKAMPGDTIGEAFGGPRKKVVSPEALGKLGLEAATVLDKTHAKGESGPRTYQARNRLAEWLDTQKISGGLPQVRKDIKTLRALHGLGESVGRGPQKRESGDVDGGGNMGLDEASFDSLPEHVRRHAHMIADKGKMTAVVMKAVDGYHVVGSKPGFSYRSGTRMTTTKTVEEFKKLYKNAKEVARVKQNAPTSGGLELAWRQKGEAERISESLDEAGTVTAAEALAQMRAGDRVSILVHAGIGRGGPEKKTANGKAVMRGPAGWALNMGGKYGTPGVATAQNLVKWKGKTVIPESHAPTSVSIVEGVLRAQDRAHERELGIEEEYLYFTHKQGQEFSGGKSQGDTVTVTTDADGKVAQVSAIPAGKFHKAMKGWVRHKSGASSVFRIQNPKGAGATLKRLGYKGPFEKLNESEDPTDEAVGAAQEWIEENRELLNEAVARVSKAKKLLDTADTKLLSRLQKGHDLLRVAIRKAQSADQELQRMAIPGASSKALLQPVVKALTSYRDLVSGMVKQAQMVESLDEANNDVDEGAPKPVTLSMADQVEMNTGTKGGGITPAIHAWASKKFGKGSGVSITKLAAAKQRGSMSIDAPKGKHISINVRGKYVIVKAEGKPTAFFELSESLEESSDREWYDFSRTINKNLRAKEKVNARKMKAKGYGYVIFFTDDYSPEPLYAKTADAAARLVRQDYAGKKTFIMPIDKLLDEAKGAASFKKGDKVKWNAKPALIAHARQGPASAGHSQATQDWRKKLSKHDGEVATVGIVFPSGNVNLHFGSYTVEVSKKMADAGLTKVTNEANDDNTDDLPAKAEAGLKAKAKEMGAIKVTGKGPSVNATFDSKDKAEKFLKHAQSVGKAAMRRSGDTEYTVHIDEGIVDVGDGRYFVEHYGLCESLDEARGCLLLDEDELEEGYEEIKRLLGKAYKSIEKGDLKGAHDLVGAATKAGASAHDVGYNLGPAAMKKMRKWVKGGKKNESLDEGSAPLTVKITDIFDNGAWQHPRYTVNVVTNNRDTYTFGMFEDGTEPDDKTYSPTSSFTNFIKGAARRGEHQTKLSMSKLPRALRSQLEVFIADPGRWHDDLEFDEDADLADTYDPEYDYFAPGLREQTRRGAYEDNSELEEGGFDVMAQMRFEDSLKPGSKVMVYWTAGSFGHYSAKATVKKLNKSSITVNINEPVASKSGLSSAGGYPKGHKINVPRVMANMGRNTWSMGMNAVHPINGSYKAFMLKEGDDLGEFTSAGAIPAIGQMHPWNAPYGSEMELLDSPEELDDDETPDDWVIDENGNVEMVSEGSIKLEGKGGPLGEKMFVVYRDGQPIGFIRKLKDTRSETFPWQAFQYKGIFKGDGTDQPDFLGSTWSPKAGKKLATDAVVTGRKLADDSDEFLRESLDEAENFDGVKVRAKGVFAKGLKDGVVYTLKKAASSGGADTYSFVTARGKKAARFDVYAIKRFLATGERGDNNGLVRESLDEAGALDLKQFEKMGAAAFKAGKLATPAHDKVLMAALKKLTKGKPVGLGIPVMKAWSRGWHAENLKGESLGEAKTGKFPVKCLECGKKFKTSSMLPTCPKCKGVDIEPDYDPPKRRGRRESVEENCENARAAGNTYVVTIGPSQQASFFPSRAEAKTFASSASGAQVMTIDDYEEFLDAIGESLEEGLNETGRMTMHDALVNLFTRNRGRAYTASNIAKLQSVSLAEAMRTLSTLVREGTLQFKRGEGYSLRGNPNAMRVPAASEPKAPLSSRIYDRRTNSVPASASEDVWEDELDEGGLGRKVFYTTGGIGKAKYVINFHDGKKSHGDGSPFYDIDIFASKAKRASKVKELLKQGYKEVNSAVHEELDEDSSSSGVLYTGTGRTGPAGPKLPRKRTAMLFAEDEEDDDEEDIDEGRSWDKPDLSKGAAEFQEKGSAATKARFKATMLVPKGGGDLPAALTDVSKVNSMAYQKYKGKSRGESYDIVYKGRSIGTLIWTGGMSGWNVRLKKGGKVSGVGFGSVHLALSVTLGKVLGDAWFPTTEEDIDEDFDETTASGTVGGFSSGPIGSYPENKGRTGGIRDDKKGDKRKRSVFDNGAIGRVLEQMRESMPGKSDEELIELLDLDETRWEPDAVKTARGFAPVRRKGAKVEYMISAAQMQSAGESSAKGRWDPKAKVAWTPDPEYAITKSSKQAAMVVADRVVEDSVDETGTLDMTVYPKSKNGPWVAEDPFGEEVEYPSKQEAIAAARAKASSENYGFVYRSGKVASEDVDESVADNKRPVSLNPVERALLAAIRRERGKHGIEELIATDRFLQTIPYEDVVTASHVLSTLGLVGGNGRGIMTTFGEDELDEAPRYPYAIETAGGPGGRLQGVRFYEDDAQAKADMQKLAQRERVGKVTSVKRMTAAEAKAQRVPYPNESKDPGHNVHVFEALDDAAVETDAEEAKAPEESTGLTLFNEDGELTLAGETVAIPPEKETLQFPEAQLERYVLAAQAAGIEEDDPCFVFESGNFTVEVPSAIAPRLRELVGV